MSAACRDEVADREPEAPEGVGVSLVREDPPPPRNKWGHVARELSELPDRAEWHRVETFTNEAAAYYAAKALRRYSVESAVRKLDGVGWGVWARWAE